MKLSQDLPGGAVVKNPPAITGAQFDPWSGKIPHAAEQLSPCATTPEAVSHSHWAHEPQLLKPTRLELVLCNKRNHRNEKPTHHNEE